MELLSALLFVEADFELSILLRQPPEPPGLQGLRYHSWLKVRFLL